MCPIAQPDGHGCPRLVDEAVPGKAAVIDDVVIGLEDAVGEPVVADELPDVFDRVELGRLRRQRHKGDIVGDVELGRKVPAGLTAEQHGLPASPFGRSRPDAKPWRRYCSAAEQARRRSLEPGKWPRRCRPSASADRAVPRGVSRAAPSPGDLVLLSDPGLVLHEGSAVNGLLAVAPPVESKKIQSVWVRGCPASQLLLRHLTCGRVPTRSRTIMPL